MVTPFTRYLFEGNISSQEAVSHRMTQSSESALFNQETCSCTQKENIEHQIYFEYSQEI